MAAVLGINSMRNGTQLHLCTVFNVTKFTLDYFFILKYFPLILY